MSDSYLPTDFIPSIFNANAKPGEPMSYGALQLRRKIAEQLMGKRSPFPQNLGQGLTFLGESIGDRMQMQKLDQAEKAYQALEAQLLAGTQGLTGGYTPGTPGAIGLSGLGGAPPPTAAPPSAPSAAAVTPYADRPAGPGDTDYTITSPRPASTAAGPTGPAEYGTIDVSDRAGAPDSGSIFGGAFKTTPSAKAPGTVFGTPAGDVPPLVGGGPTLLAQSGAPTVSPIRKMPAALPSQEAIPPQSAPYETQVRPERQRPGLLPPSPVQRQWERILSDPRLDPQGPLANYGRQILAREEASRAALQAQQQEDYTHYRGQRDAEQKLREAREFGADERALDISIKRHGLEKTKTDLEEAYYKAGLPRQQAAEQAAIDLMKGYKELYKPEMVAVAGTHAERKTDTLGRPTGEFTVPSGLPPMEEKAPTQTQAEAQQFVDRVTPDMKLLEQMNNGKILATSPASSALGGIPGIGNALMHPDYRQAIRAQENWGAAFLKHTSGLAVSTGEASRNLPAFSAVFGDTDRDLAEKAERRRVYTAAAAKVAMGSGRAMVDKANSDYLAAKAEEAKPPIRVTSPEGLKPGRRFIGPDGAVRRVPVVIEP